MYWLKREQGRTIQFDGIPFSIEKVTTLDCQYGEHYWKEKSKKTKKLKIQNTRKIGCPAKIRYVLYPDYKIVLSDAKHKEDLLNAARIAIRDGSAKSYKKHFVSLPTTEAHSGHTCDTFSNFSQRVHPIILQKISEFVAGGITGTSEVQRSIEHYVKHSLFSEHGINPKPFDRAFYPLPTDIKNHVGIAKRALEMSKFDQENLRLKIRKWQQNSPTSLHYFRPCIGSKDKLDDQPTQTNDRCTDDIQNEHAQNLLWVHQEAWQRDLLIKYGNTITLIDATYKTTKYELPLFFLCVRTNVNYTIVAEFIVQSEGADDIAEALRVIKNWNTDWSPPYFMMDCSDAEQLAINMVFPQCIVYLCDFHREQAWIRWARDRNHNLNKDDEETLLFMLRECAHAPPPKPNESLPIDHYYSEAVSNLKKSSVWTNNKQVSQWLSTKWLSMPQVRMYEPYTCTLDIDFEDSFITKLN